jgi:hypothetical protein
MVGLLTGGEAREIAPAFDSAASNPAGQNHQIAAGTAAARG